ncbi:hypothetical protein [Paenibacillus sp. TH7-28]
MGQRANLIIVRNNYYELYYSHWCASTLPQDLFWGEQHAVKFIEMQKQVDESGWLDDVWAEGGAIVDLDKKKLVFYGGEDILYHVPLRNLDLKLMRTIWSGREIAWAYEGILDLANYVGYPKEKILTYGEDDLKDASLEPPEEKDWVDTIASVMFPQNELLLFPLSGGVLGAAHLQHPGSPIFAGRQPGGQRFDRDGAGPAIPKGRALSVYQST